MRRLVVIGLALALMAPPLYAQRRRDRRNRNSDRQERLRDRMKRARERLEAAKRKVKRQVRRARRRVHLRGVADGNQLELFALDLKLWRKRDGGGSDEPVPEPAMVEGGEDGVVSDMAPEPVPEPGGDRGPPDAGRGVVRIGENVYAVKVTQIEASDGDGDRSAAFIRLAATLHEMPQRPDRPTEPEPVPMAEEGDEGEDDGDAPIESDMEVIAERPDLPAVGKMVLETDRRPLGRREVPVVSGEAGTPEGSFQILARRRGKLRWRPRPGGVEPQPMPMPEPMPPVEEGDPADTVSGGF